MKLLLKGYLSVKIDDLLDGHATVMSILSIGDVECFVPTFHFTGKEWEIHPGRS